MSSDPADDKTVLQVVARHAGQSGQFQQVEQSGPGELLCRTGRPGVEYVVQWQPGRRSASVAWRTADRWVSEAVESALMHGGDRLEELLEDELAERAVSLAVSFEHFRDEDKRYVFRTPVPWTEDAKELGGRLAVLLGAYAAVFEELAGPVE